MITITRVVTRPNGAILHLDAWPYKLAIIGCTCSPEVGQRVIHATRLPSGIYEVGDDSALITSAASGHAGMIRCYRREGLRLYERNGEES